MHWNRSLREVVEHIQGSVQKTSGYGTQGCGSMVNVVVVPG